MTPKFKVGDTVTWHSDTLVIEFIIWSDPSEQFKCVCTQEDGCITMLNEQYLTLYIEPLKPCPFCGNVNVVFTDKEYDSVVDIKSARYICCDATDGGCGATSGYIAIGANLNKEIKLWNKAKR